MDTIGNFSSEKIFLIRTKCFLVTEGFVLWVEQRGTNRFEDYNKFTLPHDYRLKFDYLLFSKSNFILLKKNASRVVICCSAFGHSQCFREPLLRQVFFRSFVMSSLPVWLPPVNSHLTLFYTVLT